jgi:bisphosphoglycerate-independent phosphoglycerate mutase (AlkP superfamily)
MPRVIYLSFDETDDMAHGGRYDLYLQAANMADRLIGDLWNFLQFMPAYQNKTALLITTDHGRGDLIKDQWRDHGTKVEDANQIWIALMGPTIRPLGENKSKGQWYQAQLAATIAALLGVEFKSNHPVAQPLDVAGRK